MDILWTGEFDLARGRNWGSDSVDSFVKKTAKLLGYDKENMEIKDAVKFLEEKFPIPADGNTPDFGGGLQHHLRDFAHHPTIVGLVFSLLTQFTEKSYGIQRNVYRQIDQQIYERLQSDMEIEKLGLMEEQTEILYNLEFIICTLHGNRGRTMKLYDNKCEIITEPTAGAIIGGNA